MKKWKDGETVQKRNKFLSFSLCRGGQAVEERSQMAQRLPSCVLKVRLKKTQKHIKRLKNTIFQYLSHFALFFRNKAQAALKLELFQTALDASESALAIDAEDHKAWYRKVQAEKGLGKFKEACRRDFPSMNDMKCNEM